MLFPYLHHFGVDVEAGVTQLSDLLGQELHPLSGVTEDNRLVDLKLSCGDKKGGYGSIQLTTDIPQSNLDQNN